jgi:hypothetical protein
MRNLEQFCKSMCKIDNDSEICELLEKPEEKPLGWHPWHPQGYQVFFE